MTDNRFMSSKKRRRQFPNYEGWLDAPGGGSLEMLSFRRPGGEYWVARLDHPSIDLWAMFLPTCYLESLAGGWRKKVAMGILKALSQKAKDVSGSLGKPDSVSKKRFPALVELLTEPTDGEGKDRELSSLTIKWQQGAFVIGIHEPNHHMSLWATGETLEGTLECLERRINADDADWRRWSDKQAAIGRKKKG